MTPSRWKWLIGIVAAVVGTGLSFPVVVYSDNYHLCENTGSSYGYREWPTGLRTGHWSKKSELELAMERHFPSVATHKWRHPSETGKNIFGSSVMHGCGKYPAVGRLKDWQFAEWSEGKKPSEILSLYKLFAGGNDRASEARVDDIQHELEFGHPLTGNAPSS